MNNLHRELAPISAAAWSDLESEVRRTFVLNAGARRVVDVSEPRGATFAAEGTGHVGEVEKVANDVELRVRSARPVVELRIPFRVSRSAIDSVERGAGDPDWDPAIRAAQQVALAEDTAIFDGVTSAATSGMVPETPHDPIALPSDVAKVPEAVSKACRVLRAGGVGGPYTLLLNPRVYSAVIGSAAEGYPTDHHLARIVGGDILWAPGLETGQLVSTRGGDYDLILGRDLSIGYHSHDAESVELYLEESFAFLVNTPEASVGFVSAGVQP